MIRLFCDRCGEDITKDAATKVGYVALNFRKGFMGELTGDNPLEHKHFCNNCMDEITRFVSQKEKEPLSASVGAVEQPDDEIPSDDDKEAQRDNERAQGGKEKPQPRKRIDHGKIRALKNAGWSNKDIADEMHMTPGAVANSLSTHKELIEELKKI